MTTAAAIEIGWRAEAALARCGGVARPIATLARVTYASAGDQLVWLATGAAAMHARAIVVGALPDGGGRITIPTSGACVWRAPAVAAMSVAGAGSAVGRAAAALVGALPARDAPAGFGALLYGQALAFPLDRAADAARCLAAACAADDADAAADAAMALVGLGPGLTPAGDDFAGAAFFARATLARDAAAARRWRRAGERLGAFAREATHPISAVLLADLVAGEAYAPLHEVAGALAIGDAARALDAACRLVAIGHSSGWDLLAGLLAGVPGAPALGGCGRVPTTSC